MRWGASALFLALTACGTGADQNRMAAQDRQTAAENGHIDCAPQGNDAFKRDCTLDRLADSEGLTLIVHNPDGGFHRLVVTKDGRGVVAADGAEPARVTIIAPGVIEVAIGGDRYRLPATVKGEPAR